MDPNKETGLPAPKPVEAMAKSAAARLEAENQTGANTEVINQLNNLGTDFGEFSRSNIIGLEDRLDQHLTEAASAIGKRGGSFDSAYEAWLSLYGTANNARLFREVLGKQVVVNVLRVTTGGVEIPADIRDYANAQAQGAEVLEGPTREIGVDIGGSGVYMNPDVYKELVREYTRHPKT